MRTKSSKTGRALSTPKASVAARSTRGRRAEQVALSTGEVARYCFVSAGSVVNWISAGQLSAQRTAGGQYRIRVLDLRDFMLAHEMRTDELDADFPPLPPCWRYWSEQTPAAMRAAAERICFECPVYRSRAAVCSEIRPLLPGSANQARACAECEYRNLRAELETAERGRKP